jgi:hypothetical protein
MEDIDRNQSYGYTSQPAQEIRFDDDLFDLDGEPKMQSVVVDAPRVQQGGGFANGGLAALIGSRYAKR